MVKRVCKNCKVPKPLSSYGLTGSGRHRRRVCHTCRSNQDRVVRQINGKLTSWQEEKNRRQRLKRQRDVPAVIVWDSRSSDRKKGLLGNDLTTSFVEGLISSGCSYCGETTLRMTLDRVDETRAHTQENVKACCIRCNYLRGSMPYLAWLCIVPSVREAREKNLFGGWRSKPLNR